MRISRQPSSVGIMVDQKQLENVKYFNYLGSMNKWCKMKVLLENDGVDQLCRSWQKWRSSTKGEREDKYLKKRKSKKANWIGYILRRHCLLKHIIEGKIERRIEVNTRRGRRRKQLLGDLKDRTGYGKLKDEAPDSALWRTSFGRCCGALVWQSIEWMAENTNERVNEWMKKRFTDSC